MGVKEHHVLRHRVLDEEVLEVPETEVGNLGNPAIGHDQHVTGLKISVDNWMPQVVKIAQTLNKEEEFICCCDGRIGKIYLPWIFRAQF